MELQDDNIGLARIRGYASSESKKCIPKERQRPFHLFKIIHIEEVLEALSTYRALKMGDGMRKVTVIWAFTLAFTSESSSTAIDIQSEANKQNRLKRPVYVYSCYHSKSTYVNLTKKTKVFLLTCLLPFLVTERSRVFENKGNKTKVSKAMLRTSQTKDWF